jgi:putative membrane protein
MRIIACQTQDRYGALVMTRITLAVALLTLALPAIALAQGSHSSDPPSAPPAETETFVHTAAVANTFEIQSSQIALQKTTNEQVKDFAHLMIKDHTRIGDELESITQKQNLQLPKGLDSKSQSSLRQLQSQSGTRFGRTYSRMMLKGHQQALKLFQSYAQNGDDKQFKEWAQQTLPTLQEHLRRAEAMERSRPTRTSAR